MEILIAILSIIAILFYLLTKNNNYWKLKNIPYEKPIFLVGIFYDVLRGKKHLTAKITEIYNKYKTEPFVGIYIFNQPVLLVCSTEMIKQIFIKDFDKFINRKIASNESADPISFHSVGSAKGKNWKSIRSKLSPAFTTGKIKLMFPLIQKVADDLNGYLQKSTGEKVEMQMIMRKYAVDIISSCAFGIDSNCLKDDNSEVFRMATRLQDPNSAVRNFSIVSFFFIPKLVDIFRLTFLDKSASDYFLNIFRSNLKIREKNNIVRNDFIDLLSQLKKQETISEGYKFDDVKMASQAIVFFSAGNESTALSLAFVLYELALNQKVQNRLRDEINEVFQKYNKFTYDGVQEIKYLDMVWKESLRKYPLAPLLNREALEDYTFEETGLKIEKGVSVNIPIAGLHYDSSYFPEPEKFIPERFSEENKQNIIPYSYLPFGDGQRACIGERFASIVAKLAIANVIKNFVFEPTEDTRIPLRLSSTSFFMASKDGITLKLTKI